MKAVLKKLSRIRWAYTDEGTQQLLEKFGITDVILRSRPTRALFTDMTNNGVLTRFSKNARRIIKAMLDIQMQPISTWRGKNKDRDGRSSS